jgi:Peptidase family M1 domain
VVIRQHAPVAGGRARLLASVVLAGVLVGWSWVSAGEMPAGVDPLAIYQLLQEARPDGREVRVTGEWWLERDAFRLRFSSGSFHLLQSVAGTTPGAVFFGEGALELVPASGGERRQLALRTGSATGAGIIEPFTRAVLLFADETEAEILAHGERSEAAPYSAAVELLTEWAPATSEEIPLDLPLRLLRGLFNDEGGSTGPFYAVVDGAELGRTLVGVDPAGILDDEGACLLVLSEGSQGYWYSSALQSAAPTGSTGAAALVDSRHYDIESRVARSTDIEGSATVEFKVLAPRIAVLPVDLYPTLKIQSVALVEGTREIPVGFLQGSAGSAALLFREPLHAGALAVVRVRYAGDGVLEDDGARIYQVKGRSNWYPNLGVFRDRATYDLTFRVPKSNTVVAVGELMRETVEAGEAVSVWRASEPISVAGFNYGDFQRYDQKEENTGIGLEVWASKGTPDAITEINQYLQDASGGLGLREQAAAGSNNVVGYINTYTGPSSIDISQKRLADIAMADAINSVQVFTRLFGPIRSRRLAITQQSQWSFGQSWPSLVYLPYLLGVSAVLQIEVGLTGYAGFFDQVGIHEIAHQWWGHRVGWHNYRDAWLSEGFAEFSTALVLELTQGGEAYDKFWERRRRALLGRPEGARYAPIQAGPLTLGFRADIPGAPGASQALVYSKGAFVLHMLRQLMRDPEEPSDAAFFAMMKDFAVSFEGQSPSTEDFQQVVERHLVPGLNAAGNGTVDWFFDQWVYGTEVPTYETAVRIERVEGDRYRLVGTVSQRGVSDSFIAMVPTYVDFGKGRLAQFGRAPFKGNMTQRLDVTLELPKKPKAVVVNARHEVLAFDG